MSKTPSNLLSSQAQYDNEEDDGTVAVDEAQNQVLQKEIADGRERRRKGKKGRRRQRNNEAAGGVGVNDLEFRDNADIELMSNDFSREHFRRMIKKTFDDYYPLEYNKSTFNMDQYLDVVSKEELEEQFSKHLEANEDKNILTLRNMPWLDLGDLPVSYNTHKTEAFQVYMIPTG